MTLANDKKFLVTGGAGFIGSTLVRLLISKTNHSVLVVDKLTYAANLDALELVADQPRYTFVQADIADASKVSDLIESYAPDVIIHLAAESHVDRSIDGPADFMQTNVMGTFTLLQAALGYWKKLPGARQEAFRFHHVSTDEVFGSLGETGLFTEATAYNPRSPYSASKAASDHLVNAWYHTYGLPVVTSNCSNNYGAYQFPEKLIPLMTINALECRALPVYGKGTNIRDWLHVEDHVRALLLVATQGRVGTTYCVGGLSEKSNIDVVQEICAIVDQLVPAECPRASLITFVKDRPGHDLRYAIDPSKIVTELGWRPQETFESGLRKTVQWYVDNSAWWNRVRQRIYGGERLGLTA